MKMLKRIPCKRCSVMITTLARPSRIYPADVQERLAGICGNCMTEDEHKMLHDPDTVARGLHENGWYG